MERLRNHLFRRHLIRWMLVPATLTVFAIAGCSDDDDDDDDNGPAPTQTTMSGGFAGGTVAGATETGTLAVTINSGTLAARFPNQTAAKSLLRPASSVVVSAAGTMDVEGIGGTIPVSGSYNTDTDSLFLSGSGYTLIGRRTNVGAGQSIEGIYTGPNGSGAFYVLAGAGVPLQSYCGTYTSGAQADSGFVALTVRNNSVTGLSVSRLDFSDIVRWNGDITGTGTARDIEIEDPLNPGGAPLADATWDTSLDTMTGTYGIGGDTGTWEATLCD